MIVVGVNRSEVPPSPHPRSMSQQPEGGKQLGLEVEGKGNDNDARTLHLEQLGTAHMILKSEEH